MQKRKETNSFLYRSETELLDTSPTTFLHGMPQTPIWEEKEIPSLTLTNEDLNPIFPRGSYPSVPEHNSFSRAEKKQAPKQKKKTQTALSSQNKKQPKKKRQRVLEEKKSFSINPGERSNRLEVSLNVAQTSVHWQMAVEGHQLWLESLGYDERELARLHSHIQNPQVFGLLNRYQNELLQYKPPPILILGMLVSNFCRKSILETIRKSPTIMYNNLNLIGFLTSFCEASESFSSICPPSPAPTINESDSILYDNWLKGLHTASNSFLSGSSSSMSSSMLDPSFQIFDPIPSFSHPIPYAESEDAKNQTNFSSVPSLWQIPNSEASSSSHIDFPPTFCGENGWPSFTTTSFSINDPANILFADSLLVRTDSNLSSASSYPESKDAKREVNIQPAFIPNSQDEENSILKKFPELKKFKHQPGGKEKIKAYSTYYPTLSRIFSKKDILRMLSHIGGARNLMAVKENFEALQKLGFNAAQIVPMVSHDGGSKNLKAVIENFEALQKLGFNAAQIVRMVSRSGGSNNLKAVIENFDALKKHFKIAQIVRMVSHGGGSNNLKAVIENFEDFLANGFDADQVVQMVSHIGGSLNLEAVKKYLDDLQALDFNTDQVVRMVSHVGGARNLAAVKENLEPLQALRFNAAQIIQMVSHNGGSRNLAAVMENFDALKALHFNAAQVVQMVSHKGGSRNLVALKENLEALQALGFNAAQVVRMVSHDGGSLNLVAIKENLESLLALRFNAAQVVRVVSHGGGARNLAAVKENFDALKALGFNADQVVEMVSHNGGSRNLAAVKENFDALKALGFDADQIVQMVSHDGGSRNLKLIKKHLPKLLKYQFTSQLLLSLMTRGRIGVKKMKEALNKVCNSMGNSFTDLNTLITNLGSEIQTQSVNPFPSSHSTSEKGLEKTFADELKKWISRLTQKSIPSVRQTGRDRLWQLPPILNETASNSISLDKSNKVTSVDERPALDKNWICV